MGSSNKAPSWADQWGGGGGDEQDDNKHEVKDKGKKMANVKVVASAGMDKAKSAAVVGTQKVKSGTRWVSTDQGPVLEKELKMIHYWEKKTEILHRFPAGSLRPLSAISRSSSYM